MRTKMHMHDAYQYGVQINCRENIIWKLLTVQHTDDDDDDDDNNDDDDDDV